MERLRSLLVWMAALDPSLTWDERLSRWANVGTVAGVVVTAFVWGVGWLFNIPWWVGLLAGLVAWVLVLNTLVALGRRTMPATEAATTASAQANSDSSQAPSSADPDEVERLKSKLAEAEQANQSLREIAEDEHGIVHWGHANAVNIGEAVNVENEQLGEDDRRDKHLDSLLREAEPEVKALREKRSSEQIQNDQRRAMIESWRYFFENYDYAEGTVRDIATYSSIRYHLSQEALVAFEDPLAVNVEIDTVRGKSPSSARSILLDEVARIEREWGLV